MNPRVSLSSWGIDISQNAVLPFDITNEQTEVIAEDGLDYFNRAIASQWDAGFLPEGQDDLLGHELEHNEPKDLLPADHLGPLTMGPSQVDFHMDSVVLLSEQFGPEQAVAVPAAGNDLVTNTRGRKRKSSTPPPSPSRAKSSRTVRACARCWIKKREVLFAISIIGL